jgi:hypothetical protein
MAYNAREEWNRRADDLRSQDSSAFFGKEFKKPVVRSSPEGNKVWEAMVPGFERKVLAVCLGHANSLFLRQGTRVTPSPLDYNSWEVYTGSNGHEVRSFGFEPGRYGPTLRHRTPKTLPRFQLEVDQNRADYDEEGRLKHIEVWHTLPRQGGLHLTTFNKADICGVLQEGCRSKVHELREGDGSCNLGTIDISQPQDHLYTLSSRQRVPGEHVENDVGGFTIDRYVPEFVTPDSVIALVRRQILETAEKRTPHSKRDYQLASSLDDAIRITDQVRAMWKAQKAAKRPAA